MSRCTEFYKKWEEHPNWCEKCPSAVSQINAYIELIGQLEENGVDKNFTMVKLSERAARPIFTEKDSNIKERTISKITDRLKAFDGNTVKKITLREVEEDINTIKKDALLKKLHNTSHMPDDIQIIHGDFSELSRGLEDNSIDLILTDPPYAREYLPCWEHLAIESARILKPGGFLVVYSGNVHFPEVLNYLSKSLTYFWLGGVKLNGQVPRIWQKHVFHSFRIVLIFHKEPLKLPEWFNDLLINESPDKAFHEWGQGVKPFMYLLDKFSKPGDLVLDPFCGGGTTAVACMGSKRRCMTYEIDRNTYEMAKARISSYKLYKLEKGSVN